MTLVMDFSRELIYTSREWLAFDVGFPINGIVSEAITRRATSLPIALTFRKKGEKKSGIRCRTIESQICERR